MGWYPATTKRRFARGVPHQDLDHPRIVAEAIDFGDSLDWVLRPRPGLSL